MNRKNTNGNKFPKPLKRIFLIMGILALLGVLCVVGLNIWVVASTSDSVYELTAEGSDLSSTGEHDCILVLGAGLKDGKPSPMLQDRLEKGIACYKQGIAPKLLMSGDHGRTGYNEVQVMKQYAIDAGVPSSDIFMDHAGFSTYESLIRARDIFGVKSPVIVTQKYHIYRALYIGSHLDHLNCIGVPTDYYPYGGRLSRNLREYLARCKDVATVLFGTSPTYGGDPIPITGDGDLTND